MQKKILQIELPCYKCTKKESQVLSVWFEIVSRLTRLTKRSQMLLAWVGLGWGHFEYQN